MLNPELVRYYGENCKPFFNEFIKRVHPNIAEKCYAIKGLIVESGDLCGPQFVGVVDNMDVMRRVGDYCISITRHLKDKEEERDIGVLSITMDEESARKDGIKIWV